MQKPRLPGVHQLVERWARRRPEAVAVQRQALIVASAGARWAVTTADQAGATKDPR